MKIRWLILFLCPAFLLSQVTFMPESTPWGEEQTFSGVAMGVYDMNGDHLDDMIILDGANHLKVFHQTLNSDRFKAGNFGKVSLQDQFSLVAGDLDNDGIAEILVGGFYDGIKIYKQYENSDAYLLNTTTPADFYTQNISLVDVDNDGFLDIYANDDDGIPRLFRNVDGLTLEPWELIDFGAEGEAASGNYGSVWTDFDLDGDLDLYISKCRLGVDDAGDPRRINQLYVNEGGGFNERAADYGLASGEQTWVTDFVDLDNDLDLDVVMVNHTGGNEMYENLGEGEYLSRDIGSAWHQVFEGLQVIVRDFDQDGLKDIAIAGVESKLFWNKGGFVFEEDENDLSVRNTLSMAVGDLNHDGKEDLVAGYAKNLVERNEYFPDEVLLNQGMDGPRLKLSLVGEESNRDAIGAKVYAYSEKGHQLVEVKNGSSYGIACSRDVVFGFGSGDGLDSLVIVWPLGGRSQYRNIDLNKHYIINENGCVSEFMAPELPDERFLCPAVEYQMNLGGYVTYEWSTGEQDSVISVSETGYFQATVTDGAGCEDVTGLVSVESFQIPVLELVDRKKIYCEGEGLVVTVDYPAVRWSNGAEGKVNYDLARDDIYAEFLVCDEWLRSEVLDIELLQVDTPEYLETTVLKGETGLWQADGEQVQWYENEVGGIAFHEGAEWTVDGLLEDSTLFVANVVEVANYDYGGLSYDVLHSSYPGDNTNGGLVIRVGEYQTRLQEVKCISDVEATRKFLLTDYWGNVIAERSVLVGPSDTIVRLDFVLNPHEIYILTTCEEVNMTNHGTRSPRLVRSSKTGGYYPLVSESGNVVVEESTGGAGVYYSFYDMVFLDYELMCASERVGITVYVDQGSGAEDVPGEGLMVHPNPVVDFLHVANVMGEDYSIISMDGRVVRNGKWESEGINVMGLNPGVYGLKIASQTLRFMKI